MRNLLTRYLRRNLRRPLPPQPKPTTTIHQFTHPHHHYSSVSTASTSPPPDSPPQPQSWPNSLNFLIGLFSRPTPEASAGTNEYMLSKTETLKRELIEHKGDIASVHHVLHELGSPLFTFFDDGSALIELLEQLYSFPLLAVEVFDWRRKHAGFTFPITSAEYAKGIRVAGRARDIDLAVELFTEATNNRMKTSTTYNALMGAYMMNGLAEKCQLLCQEFKEDQLCRPTIVTYNILLSVFGRLMLIDNMEATVREIDDSGLTPNVSTFNNLIAGYLTAWMWDRMENTYLKMEEMSINPDIHTYRLLLRGFAHAGNLKKMEEMYVLLKQHSDGENTQIIRNMICAYCKISCPNRSEKIDALLALLPEQEYRSWLIVMLIRMYAQEKELDKMEKFIGIALKSHTTVVTADVMRAVITAYFQSDAVDKLIAFVKLAQCARWKLCRSLFHCKMVMFALHNRLEEMENVFFEMEKFNINSRTIKSLTILYKGYSKWGPKCKLEQVVGLMLKSGYDACLNELPSLEIYDQA